jgi:hypothetical protein
MKKINVLVTAASQCVPLPEVQIDKHQMPQPVGTKRTCALNLSNTTGH